ncbi:MAG: ATP-dependent DNA ligase [Candidatus Woesearchaeota archaeon]
MQYKKIVDLYIQLDSTTKRLGKTYYISEFLKHIPTDEIKIVALLLQGKLYPAWDKRDIGVAARIVLKAISVSSGISTEKVEREWKKTGDLGDCAHNLIGIKKQTTLVSHDLSVDKVFNNLRKLAELEGQGTVDKKVHLIAELLTSSSPDEAKYIIRTILDELRIGVGEGAFRDAIVWAFFGDKFNLVYNNKDILDVVDDQDRERFNFYSKNVQHMIDIINDYSEVMYEIKKKGEKAFGETSLEVGKPIKVMLAQKAEDIDDAFERVGKPALFEYKYDGFRMQIHRNGDHIKLFTRRLEDVTEQFPDVVKLIKENTNSNNFILDSEVIGIDPKTKKWLPFQSISQRIRRKYDINEIIKKIPVMVNVFDAVQINGKQILKKPIKERKELIKSIIKEKKEKIEIAKGIITESKKEAERFYQEALAKGNEGLMAKSLDSEYKPGSRVGFMVKIKPVMENLDLVITGAQWGEGKRSKWLSSFTIACKDGEEYSEIGKVGTGIRELESDESDKVTFMHLTKLLKPLIISEKGKEIKVKPSIVIEISYNEIQKSPTYSSGFALRFPRLVRLREDRKASDIDNLSRIKDFYHKQVNIN